MTEILSKVEKNKVAVIVWQFPNRSNTFVVNEMMELHHAGVDLTIYSMYRSTRDECNVCKEIYKNELSVLKDKIINVSTLGLLQHKYVREHQLPIDGNRWRQELEQQKMVSYPDFEDEFKQIEDRAVQNSKQYVEKLIAHMLTTGITKIYAPFAAGDATKAMMVSHHTGIPYYFTAHALDLFTNYYYTQGKKETVEHVFTISEYNKKYMIETCGFPQEKITVKRVNFLAPDEASIKSKNLKYKYIFSAGRLTEMKGHEYTIKAFNMFHNVFPDIKYLIAGNGELDSELRQLVRDLELEQHVIFLGHVSNNDVLEYVKQAEFCILSSIEMENKDKEGLPTCFVESMSLGTPCVGTNYSGIPELIDHGINGMLTMEKNVHDIFEKMTDLCRMISKDTGNSISEKCKTKIDSMFDNKKNINLLVDHLSGEQVNVR